MKAKEYLQQLRLFDEKLKQNKKDAEELKLRATTIKGIDYSSNKVQMSESHTSLSDNIVRYMNLEEQIESQTWEFLQFKHQIINQIQELDDAKYLKVLFKHYVEYKKLDIIAKEMKYTYVYIRELHGKALKAFEKVQPDNQPTAA